MTEFLTSENLIETDDLSKALYNTQCTCLSRKLTVSTKKRREILPDHKIFEQKLDCSQFTEAKENFSIAWF